MSANRAGHFSFNEHIASKRGKELLWAAVGYLALLDRRTPARFAPTGDEMLAR